MNGKQSLALNILSCLLVVVLLGVGNHEACLTRIPRRPTTDAFRYPYYLQPYYPPPPRYRRSISDPKEKPKQCGQSISQQSFSLYALFRKLISFGRADQQAVVSAWPWIAGLYAVSNDNRTYLRCSGALIDSSHVLTSAHCLVGLLRSRVLVSLGSSRVVFDSNDSSLRSVKKIIIHDGYPDASNDLALIKLNATVKFSQYLSPVCLPIDSNSSKIFNKNVIVTGWPSIRYKQTQEYVSNRLLQDEFRVKNEDNSCKIRGASGRYCAVAIRHNACWSNLGAPMVYYTNGTWQIYGVASGFSVDRTNHLCDWTAPSLFTMVPKYLNWIIYNTQKS